MKRAKLKRMYLDVNFFSNPKIEALFYKFGSNSTACLIEIMCGMSRATNAQVDDDFIFSRISKHQIKDGSDFLDYLISKSILIKEGEFYSNGVVIADQESYAQKLEASNERVTRYREKRNALHGTSETISPDNDYDTDNEYIKEKIQPKSDPLDLSVVPLKVTKAINRWENHRQRIGKPLDQQALDSLVMLYANRFDEMPDDIDYSITNGWKTLQQKPRHQQNQKTTKPPDTPVRRHLENFKPPTKEEMQKPTEESKARIRELIATKLEKRGVQS